MNPNKLLNLSLASNFNNNGSGNNNANSSFTSRHSNNLSGSSGGAREPLGAELNQSNLVHETSAIDESTASHFMNMDLNTSVGSQKPPTPSQHSFLGKGRRSSKKKKGEREANVGEQNDCNVLSSSTSRLINPNQAANLAIIDESKMFVSDKERETIINNTLNNLDTIQRKLALSELKHAQKIGNNPGVNTASCNTSSLLLSNNPQLRSNHSFSSIGLSNDIFNMTTITYKSKYLLPFTFLMLAFTLLPIQYHSENFGLQMKVMIDSCIESAGFFGENQTSIFDTIFPYGFSSSLSFDSLSNDMKAIDELQRKQTLSNLTIKYMSQSECLSNNFTKILNIITINPSPTIFSAATTAPPSPFHKFNLMNLNNYKLSNHRLESYDSINLNSRQNNLLKSSFVFSNKNQQASRQSYNLYQPSEEKTTETAPEASSLVPEQNHHIPHINLIIICDDESYKKSLTSGNGGSTVIPLTTTTPTTTTFFNDLTGSSSNSGLDGLANVDTFDFQTNILSQWNISCKNLSLSTVTISYAQMTFLSGEIIGAIFFSMLADYIGRKRIYLVTLYVSTIIGSLVSIVQSYKQFVIIRFPIAALTQGCFIVSYVLLFEMILKSQHRNVYCSIFVSSQFICNFIIALMTKVIKDWRYMQLTGSLLTSFAIAYPWLIKESFKWLIVRDDFINAERVCKGIFKENGIIARLMKLKSDDQLNEEFQSASWWPMVIWQPTFRKIICCFVLLWSVLSLTNFFINEEVLRILTYNVDNYIVQNVILALFNVGVGVVYFRVGKRFPLGSCLFLGGSFYLASSLISQDLNAEWLRILFHLLAKVLISCGLNILMLYVCELFPCEIRCSSLSFFLSIKHLSEMFAIYIFKVNVLSMGMIKIGLAVFSIIMCICALLLPEKSAFAFNLDYLEFLNRNHQFIINSSSSTARKNTCRANDAMSASMNIESQSRGTGAGKPGEQTFSNDEETAIDEDKLAAGVVCTPTLTTTMATLTLKNTCQSAQLYFNQNPMRVGGAAGDDDNEDDCEQSILANTLIKKINCENHCKTGKLNPLYEEDQVVSTASLTIQNQQVNVRGSNSSSLASTPTPSTASKFSRLLNLSLSDKNQPPAHESSTKF